MGSEMCIRDSIEHKARKKVSAREIVGFVDINNTKEAEKKRNNRNGKKSKSQHSQQTEV